MPRGVQGTNPSCPISIFPMFSGLKPSTSFSGAIFIIIVLSSMCFGSGNCTSIPCISCRRFRVSISSIIFSCGVSAWNLWSSDAIPTRLHAQCFNLTYNFEGGCSPTRIVASAGLIPFSRVNFSTSFLTPVSILCAIFLPSMTRGSVTSGSGSILITRMGSGTGCTVP